MKHSDIIDVENLIENTYRLVETTENRQDSSYKVNIFTLNYDDIVETILQNKSYVNNVLNADSYKKTTNSLTIKATLSNQTPGKEVWLRATGLT